MSSRVFIDTNIILDFFDAERISHKDSLEFFNFSLKNNFELFTSFDIITTLYYINSKKDKLQALKNIQNINKTLKVIEFSNQEVEQTCSLMLEDSNYKDLEDTIQYVLAKKLECDLIVSNDKNFIGKDIKLTTSKEFCKSYKT